MDYVFITDASCDLNEKQVSEIGVQVIPMEFQMEGKSFLHYPDRHMMSLEEFYSKLKRLHPCLHSLTFTRRFFHIRNGKKHTLRCKSNVLFWNDNTR